MTAVLLLHSVLGVTPGLTEFADRLRAAGHTVEVPDLFEGNTFETVEAGMANLESIGFAEAIERGVRAADDLPEDLVYAGFSFGVMPAEKLTITRPGAKGALFFESCAPTSFFGDWPQGVPLQIHGMEEDPYFAGEGDIDADRELVDQVGAELFVYPGDKHLFADSSLPWYDAEATELLTARVLEFLADR